MEASICSQDKSVGLYFVRPAEGASSPCLLAAYQACERFMSKWISAEECLQMSPTKQDVFVCDPFEGKAFAHLTSGFKCVVVGPRCILSCLHRIEPIPQLPSPIHNTAMRGLVITTTGFEKAKKEEIKCLVERMAGIYAADYHMGITHLVANEVGTKKYQVAVEQEIPIMTGEWVSAVWNAVAKDLTQHILATDERFLSHACPVLYGMVVCVSQLDRATKLALQGIIEENGGTYSPLLEMSKTSVLIVSAPEGEKYRYACKWRIKCLTPDWIYDSVQRGHALQMGSYEVKKQNHSTPNNSHLNSMLSSELSQCSAITGEGVLHRSTSVDESVEMKDSFFKEKRNSLPKEINLGLEAVESLDLQEVQRAGLFLDGCKIFLSGFSNNHLEKLRRVLNFGGATRFSKLTEAVSHMIIGKPVKEHLALVRELSTRPHLVYAHWITESIKLRRPAEEGQFMHSLEEEAVVEEVRQFQHPTTATTSNISSSHNTPVAQSKGEVPHEDEVLKQYLKPGQVAAATSAATAASSSVVLSDSRDHKVSKAFTNKIFTISGYSQDMKESLTGVVEEYGGQVVPLNYEGHVHYSLMTAEGQGHSQAEEVVSHYFLEDCVTTKRLVPVEYYHMPLMPLGDTYPLENCCITISTYIKMERTFLENMAILLGARNQDMFAKKPNPGKNVVPSTHLVCPLPSGNKYQAAKKWGVPVVSADWLLECARVTSKVPEDSFLVESPNHLKLDKKKVFRDILAANCKRRQMEETGQEASPMRHRARNKSGSSTPSPDKLHQSYTTAEMHPTPGRLRSQEEEAAHDTSPHRLRKRLKPLVDSFSTPTLSQKLDKNTPGKEFYKKFYKDIKETMQKYTNKPQLQLQESGTAKVSIREKRDREKNEKEQQEKKQTRGPLKGLVVCPSRKFLSQGAKIASVVKQLGGQYLSSYGPEVTHFLYQGRSNDFHWEFRKAKQDGKIIVAPDWLWMCQENDSRVDEVLFPYTQNPNMSLTLEGGTPANRSKGKRKCPEGEEEDNSQQQNLTESSGGRKEKDTTQEKKEKLSKQLEEIGALAQLSGKKNNGARGRSKPFGEWPRPTSSKHIDIETQPMSSEEPESQGTAITWEDPLEREARLHLQKQLNGDTLDQVYEENTVENMKEVQKPEGRPTEEETALPVNTETVLNDKSQDTLQLMFMLVGMSEEKRQHYSKMVEELGATVSHSSNFNFKVTHLVAETLSRSERTLSAIASGKWVLHNSYLDHSHEAGHFLKEELYTWGNPAAQHLPSLPPESTHAQLAKAAWRWRTTINSPGGHAGKPFQHMVAVIQSSKDRVGSFSRMIEAGGGKVVTAKPPYKDLEGITHFFLEMNKSKEAVDLDALVAKGIPCLKPIFINNYLIMDPLPEEEDHYVSQYKDLLLSMSSHNQSNVKRQRKE